MTLQSPRFSDADRQGAAFVTDEVIEIRLHEPVLMERPGLEETENEFRYRLRDPGDFQAGSFRRIPLKKDKPRVFGIIGRLKGETKTTLQALRFPKADGWDKESAGKWARAHRERLLSGDVMVWVR